MFNPEWIEAAADVVAAIEKGVSMRSRKQPEATAAPPPPTVVVNGITGAEYLLGVFLLALAVLGAAVIIHHGLTA